MTTKISILQAFRTNNALDILFFISRHNNYDKFENHIFQSYEDLEQWIVDYWEFSEKSMTATIAELIQNYFDYFDVREIWVEDITDTLTSEWSGYNVNKLIQVDYHQYIVATNFQWG